MSLSDEDITRAVRDLAANGWASIALPPSIDDSYGALVDDARCFFARPDAEKEPFDIRASVGHRGWVPTDEQGDYADEGQRRYEAFDIGRRADANDRIDHPLRGRNRWPTDRLGRRLGGRAEAFYGALAALSDRIGDAICDDLGVPAALFRSLRREPVSQLRLIHYLAAAERAPLPTITVDEHGESCIDLRETPAPSAMGAHTDYEFFTLLYQSDPGTQVLDDDGNWIDVPHTSTLTVLAGDMLDIFSGGRFVSTLHRAAGKVEAGRVSIPFFAAPDFTATVRPVVGERTDSCHFGDHFMTQLRRDFPYLRDRTEPNEQLRVSLFEAARWEHVESEALLSA